MSDQGDNHLMARLDRLESKVDMLVERTAKTEVWKGALVVLLSAFISIAVTVGASVLSEGTASAQEQAEPAP